MPLNRLLRKPWVLVGGIAIVGVALWAWASRPPSIRPQTTDAAGGDHDHAAHDHGSDAAHKGHDHSGHDHAKHDHGEHSHDHPGHDEASAIELSQQAQNSIGLKVAKIALGPFERTISVPAIVVDVPGRSKIVVAAPMTGIVDRLYPIEGEAVQPGDALFELRLTHEELVQAQSDFLKTAEELDVVGRELARLENVARGGAIAGKTVLEREYERQKLEGVQRAQRQSLLLHGLTEAQIDEILAKRKLLQRLTVRVPPDESADQQGRDSRTSNPSVLQVQDLRVERGQQVNAGDALCVLADHKVLYIEGTAFAQDVGSLNRAVNEGVRVSAVREQEDGEVIEGLEIVYLENRVDPQTRAFHFYVNLPNALLRDRTAVDRKRFINWRFKPGERMQLQVPVETWKDRIVLPIAAVAQDGAETYVFKQFKDHFDRAAVHVEYRDARHVVIANDGILKPGDVVSVSGAHQMQISLKNKAGGAIDPHAGHHH